MGRKLAAPYSGAGAAAAGDLPPGLPASGVADCKPENWDAEYGPTPESPTAKSKRHTKPHTAGAAVRRKLFAAVPDQRHWRRVAIAAAAACCTLLLLVAASSGTRGSSPTQPSLESGSSAGLQQRGQLGAQPGAWIPREAAMAWEQEAGQRGEAGGGAAGSVQASGASLSPAAAAVEFTAPGLVIPLRDALDLALPEQPEERALLALLPQPGTRVPPAPTRPTLEEVLRRYKEQRAANSSSSSGHGSGGSAPAHGATDSGSGPGRALAADGSAVLRGTGLAGGDTTQAASGTGKVTGSGKSAEERASGGRPPSIADLANELQASLQQEEEAARRAFRERLRLEAEHAQKAAKAGSTDPAADEREVKATAGQGGALRAAEAPVDSSSSGGGSSADGSGARVRLLVGVVSACCSQEARRRRAVIRDTWGRILREKYPFADLRFFLAQPPSAAVASAWLPVLQDEATAHGDVVVVRGPDEYRNLPNKTLRLLRYSLAHPAGYTHMLKTDDDCYVRMQRVLAALRAPLDSSGQLLPLPGRVGGGGTTSTMAAALAAGKAAQAAAGGAESGDDGDSGQAAGLPAMRQQLLQSMGRSGKPLHTDGIVLYNVTDLVKAAGAAAASRHLDTEKGEPVSLAQLANDATAVAQQLADLAAAKSRPTADSAGRQQQGEGSSHGGSQALGRALAAQPEKAQGRQQEDGPTQLPPFRMEGVYLGCVENPGGFFPIRDSSSKWYLSYDSLPDSAVPFAVKYLAGWGVVLSRDLVDHAVRSANALLRQGDAAPAWFRNLPFEDVMLGMLLMDVVPAPQHHAGFRAAWRACSSDTAVKHLDVDAPALFRGLYEQDVSGLWARKPVQCSSGDFLPGDYGGWKRWRDSLPSVEHI